jgi:hypothetical protein
MTVPETVFCASEDEEGMTPVSRRKAIAVPDDLGRLFSMA